MAYLGSFVKVPWKKDNLFLFVWSGCCFAKRSKHCPEFSLRSLGKSCKVELVFDWRNVLLAELYQCKKHV